MRVIWLLGGHAKNKELVEKAFARPALQVVNYLIRQTQNIEEIPVEHLQAPGVTVLVDSFHPQMPGFESLRALRQKGFKGSVYLFGEPAPESALEPFKNLGLTGYFPPFERADFHYASGLIHHQLNYVGQLDLMAFLGGGGKAASETIHNLREFNLFIQKMTAFVSRFGVDVAQLRKVLMGLSLAHVKTSSGHAAIEQAFTILFGMDPSKIILAAPAFSKGAASQNILEEFCGALGSLKSTPNLQSSIFPEIHHVARATENLVIFGGSAKSATDAMDPMYLMTTLSFPKTDQNRNAPVYSFAFAHVKATEELDEITARLEIHVTPAAAADSAPPAAPLPRIEDILNEPLETPTPEAIPATPLPSVETSAPQGALEATDISKILSDPPVMGDAPKHVEGLKPVEGDEPMAAPVNGESSFKVEGTPAVVMAEIKANQDEIARLKELAQIMGQDIRRLMKERRQPTTDRELRDANQMLEEKIKALNVERTRTILETEKRDKQIEELKAIIQTLRQKTAA